MELVPHTVTRPYTFHCDGCVPFLKSVTLPTLADVGRVDPMVRGYSHSNPGEWYNHFTPTPLARALVAAVPTLRGIGVAELRADPEAWGECGFCRIDDGPDWHTTAWDLPAWLWDKLPLEVSVSNSRWKVATTEAAANWALESTLYRLVKEAK
jgi:hypothetical protein